MEKWRVRIVVRVRGTRRPVAPPDGPISIVDDKFRIGISTIETGGWSSRCPTGRPGETDWTLWGKGAADDVDNVDVGIAEPRSMPAGLGS